MDWRAARNGPFRAFIGPARRPQRPAWLAYAVVAAAFFIFVVGVFAIADVMTPAHRPSVIDEALYRYPVLASLVVIIAMGALVIALMALINRRGPSTLLGRRFGRGVLVGAAAYLVFIAIWMIGYEALILAGAAPRPPEMTPNASLSLGFLVVLLALIAAQSISEELVFRGYLLQQIAVRCKGPWAWALLPSLAFAGLHVDGTLPPAMEQAVIAAMTLFALTACYATWRTGSTGVACGLHILNNWLAFVVIGLVDDPLSVHAFFLALWPSPVEIGAFALTEAVVVVLLLETPGSPARRWLGVPPFDDQTPAITNR